MSQKHSLLDDTQDVIKVITYKCHHCGETNMIEIPLSTVMDRATVVFDCDYCGHEEEMDLDEEADYLS